MGSKKRHSDARKLLAQTLAEDLHHCFFKTVVANIDDRNASVKGCMVFDVTAHIDISLCVFRQGEQGCSGACAIGDSLHRGGKCSADGGGFFRHKIDEFLDEEIVWNGVWQHPDKAKASKRIVSHGLKRTAVLQSQGVSKPCSRPCEIGVKGCVGCVEQHIVTKERAQACMIGIQRMGQGGLEREGMMGQYGVTALLHGTKDLGWRWVERKPEMGNRCFC